MNSSYQKPADPGIQRLVNRIAKMAGVAYRIEVFSTEEPLACGTFFKPQPGKKDKPAIQYNPVFMEQLRTINPWADVALFAQEVAYHFNNNLYGEQLAESLDIYSDEKTDRKEIKADRFTGWVLWHEGAKLKEAVELYHLPRFSNAIVTESTEGRMKTMKMGWIKAYNKLLPKKRDNESDKNPDKPENTKEDKNDTAE